MIFKIWFHNHYVYLELKFSTHAGGEIHAQVQLELNWFMLEELGGHSTILKEEDLTYFVYLKILTILLTQQESQA